MLRPPLPPPPPTLCTVSAAGARAHSCDIAGHVGENVIAVAAARPGAADPDAERRPAVLADCNAAGDVEAAIAPAAADALYNDGAGVVALGDDVAEDDRVYLAAVAAAGAGTADAHRPCARDAGRPGDRGPRC